MDAGTDNGFTFTAPNWATTPPAAIFRITNVYPTHPASSFHYPDLDSLPTIATFSFIKVAFRVIYTVRHVGWVDFDLGIPQCCMNCSAKSAISPPA